MNRTTRACVLFLLLANAVAPAAASAQSQGVVTGTVVDPLGARVSGATVSLVGSGGPIAEERTAATGVYRFEQVPAGRYQLIIRSEGFEPFASEPVFVGGHGRTIRDVTLQVGRLEQAVVVTASASGVPQSQTGAPVSVLDAGTIEALNKPDLLEALRLVPGAQVVQVGARGGGASLFIRGGNANFHKVLVDGVPANDIGGAFDFGQLATSGVERVEVLRQANSVVYGSDALAGVVNITTKRGQSRTPQLEYSLDGGNLGTIAMGLSTGGVVDRFDYFSSYSLFETDNDLPNNAYRNRTYAGRFGVAIGGGTDVSASVRRIDADFDSPNAFSLFRVADDSSQDKEQTYLSVIARSQWTNRLQSSVRFGWIDERFVFVNPAPSGSPFDPFGFGANHLGEVVTLTGGNGFTVTGRGILDFGGAYPRTFDSRTGRRLVAGDATYQARPALTISAGARVEREEGFDDPGGQPIVTRDNGGVFVEGRGTLLNRHYISAGLGYERNEVFASAVTPRLSIASYVRQPSSAVLADTKVTLNAGTGIKAPSVFQEQNSLFALVQGTPVASRVSPVGPERSRSFDVGVEQGLIGGNARIRAAYFHNTFDDLLEFLGRTQLVQVGVPSEAAAATPFGAYANAASYTARGVELSGEAAAGDTFRFAGSYTFLDAEVTRALGASASFNPAFPGIPIGAFSPLVGERPFRRPTHSGTLMVAYREGPAQVTLSGYFAGTRDDSTFLSDPFFGSSMLLPNQDLAAAYQKIDLSGSYRVHPRLRAYVSIENVLDQEYEAAFGYPSLPLTARIGFRVTLGGD